MDELGVLVALAAGVLTLLSPCSAMLLPAFFAYAFSSRTVLVRRTVAFYLGLCLTLVPLGTGVGLASRLFYGHRSTLIWVTGSVMVALGVLQILGGSFAVPLAARFQGVASRLRGTGTLAIVALGATYGLAGFCSGPVLGAILTMAATTSAAGGAALLAVYALGMSVPLFLLALVWDRLGVSGRSWIRGRTLRLGPVRTHTSSLVAGILFVVIGVLFIRFQGTAGITGTFGLGDTTDLEISAQEWLVRWLGGVPLWAVALAVAAVAAAVAVRRTRRRNSSAVREGDVRQDPA